MKTKKILLILLLTILIIGISTTVHAYQSIPTGTSKSDYATNWMPNIRNMEKTGGEMGLNQATVAPKTLIDTDLSDNGNNIDVHMQKNTEYGAAILLGASDYGKQGSGTARYMNSGGKNISGTATNLATSTGNVYGMYELGYYNMGSSTGWEWTAGGGTSFLNNITSKRYRDIYTTNNVGKAGDATVENGVTFGSSWHGSSYANFATYDVGFIRGYGGVFSYYDKYYARSTFDGSGDCCCRAVVVCGSGF